MKNQIVITFVLLGLIPSVYAQDSIQFTISNKNRFEMFIHAGVSTQIHSYPNIDTDGYMERPMPVFGIGGGYTHHINSWLSIKSRLNYLQKGCTYRGSIHVQGNGYSIRGTRDGGVRFQYDNKFHYLSGDIMAVLKLNRWKVKPYFQTGIRNEILVHYSIDYDISEYNDYFYIFDDMYRYLYPNNTNYKDFNRFNAGVVTGAGLQFKKGWFVELNHNFDLGYVLNTPEMWVRNLNAVVTVGMKPF